MKSSGTKNSVNEFKDIQIIKKINKINFL